MLSPHHTVTELSVFSTWSSWRGVAKLWGDVLDDVSSLPGLQSNAVAPFFDVTTKTVTRQGYRVPGHSDTPCAEPSYQLPIWRSFRGQ